jgi:serine/threonine protein kinase/tetratricopeptide (TPR) repeat protein
MNPNWPEVKEVFSAALELGLQDRLSFVDNACGGDEGLRAEVLALLAAHEAATDFIDSPALIDIGMVSPEEVFDQPVFIGRRIGPYEIVRELGHGGMGTVFLAVRADDEYRKQVAIKLINRGMDTDLILRRFMMERQILANLEHPNIARLLEGGSTEDGLPYFIMEYIEGQRITQYCDAQLFTTIERLELFRQVCSALQYAHQNLVVHRDIKPSNILVTAEGVPKLLDFGIAKLLSPGWDAETGEATASMVQLMTPEYASPEQLRGLAITTTSDVYSLGLVLYELLSGHHPYRLASRQAEEVARVVLQSEPERPSVVVSRQQADDRNNATQNHEQRTTDNALPAGKTNPLSAIRNPKSLRGDLDNIVLKALRKEPERRYASMQELSEDIRRHLEGLPVMASPDTLGYRAGKFVQRNKIAVLAAAVVVITLLTATVVTTWQARVARMERDKAQRRFGEVRKLANAVLFKYHDGIERLPGSTPVREMLVQDALEYLDALAKESANDPSLQKELAAAYEKVGDVQGSPFRSNLGNYKGALASHQKAQAIREKLVAASPSDEQLKLELARSYGAVGELLHETGNLAAALEHYDKAFAVFDLITKRTADTSRELSILDVRYGKALAESGKLKEAVEKFQNGIAIANELSTTNQGDQKLVRAEAFAHISLGDAYVDMGQLKEALANHRQAFALLGPLVSPTNAQSRRDVAVAYVRVADVMAKMGDKKGALEMELKALTEDEEAVKVDPTNALVQRDVYIDYYKIAFMQEAMGDLKAALANQHRCVALVKAAVVANPASAKSHADLAVAYFRLGEMFENSANRQEALSNYQKAVEIEESIANADPANTVARGDLSEDLMKVSDVSLKLGDRPKALEGYRKALAIREELVAKTPDDVEGRTQLARLYESLGDCFSMIAESHKRGPDWQEAKNRYQQSLDIWNDLQLKGTLAPDYAKKPNEVKQKMVKYEAALRN